MLVLSRKKSETIKLFDRLTGEAIATIVVTDASRSIKLGLIASDRVGVVRGELQDQTNAKP